MSIYDQKKWTATAGIVLVLGFLLIVVAVRSKESTAPNTGITNPEVNTTVQVSPTAVTHP